MIMEEICSDEINRLVNIFIPNRILRSGALLNGGFCTWLLYLYITVDDWDLFFENLYKRDNMNNPIYSYFANESTDLLQNLPNYFDIDISYTSGSPLESIIKYIGEKRSAKHRLIKDFFGLDSYDITDDESQLIFKAERYKIKFKCFKFRNIFTKKIIKIRYPFGLISIKDIFQIRKDVYLQEGDIFNTVDFKHNEVFFKENRLYFSKSAFESIRDRIIIPTDYFINNNSDSAYNSLYRAFKYKLRYNMKLSEKLSDKIYNLYNNLSEDIAFYNNFKNMNCVSVHAQELRYFNRKLELIIRRNNMDYMASGYMCGKDNDYKVLSLQIFDNFLYDDSFKEDYLPALICSGFRSMSDAIIERLNSY